jgi:iron-sulfur cluster repair protein YtfE (RIC family)
VTKKIDNCTAAGSRMIAQLRAVHRPLRADVKALRDALRELANATIAPDALQRTIAGLTVAQLGWQLSTRCQYFCEALSVHHMIEDARMLPTMLRHFPKLRPTIERLQRDHKDVHRQLKTIMRAADTMDADAPNTVQKLANAIATLADHLETHLDFEEESLFPYFARMNVDWHYG